MGAMQNKILTQLRQSAECRGLEFNVQEEFANCGQAYVQSGWETIAIIRYDFQTAYASFTITGPALARFADGEDPRAVAEMQDVSRAMVIVQCTARAQWVPIGGRCRPVARMPRAAGLL